MKVFGFIGSLHDDSYTAKLISDLVEKMGKKGLDPVSDIFFARDSNINICNGCNHCFYDGRCNINDDYEKIHEKMLQADLIILGSPVYLHNVSGAMKNFIDRSTKGIYIFEMREKMAVTLSVSGNNGNKFVNSYLHKILSMLGAYVIDDLAFTQIMDQKTINDINSRCCEKIYDNVSQKIDLSDKAQEQRYLACKNMVSQYSDDNWIKKYWIQHGLFNFSSYADLVKSNI